MAHAGSCLAPIAGLLSPKVKAGVQGRRGAVARLRSWGARFRDPARPLAWFHASSVGEGLQASAVLHRLQQRHPDWQFAYTHFSASAAGFAHTLDVDVSDYLPWDTPVRMEAVLEALHPSALVFAKLDLWPELATQAAMKGIPVVLVAGTVRPRSSRLYWPARSLTRPGYEALARAGAISPEDGRRLERLGVRPEVIVMTGDPRHDSVNDQIRALEEDNPYRALGDGATVIVAGSTWPGDEDVLLEAFARLEVHRPEARLLLVPHEPTPAHLARIAEVAARHGLPRPVLLSEWPEVDPGSLVVVDRVGVLAALYPVATLAYVGGGFHGRGLHSVLEPAACGIPVVFGPRWSESRDAHLLMEAGAAEALAEFGATEAAESLQKMWDEWMSNEVRRKAQGRKARGVVEHGLGAAARSAVMIEELLQPA